MSDSFLPSFFVGAERLSLLFEQGLCHLRRLWVSNFAARLRYSSKYLHFNEFFRSWIGSPGPPRVLWLDEIRFAGAARANPGTEKVVLQQRMAVTGYLWPLTGARQEVR
jgi:hypothetical protein